LFLDFSFSFLSQSDDALRKLKQFNKVYKQKLFIIIGSIRSNMMRWGRSWNKKDELDEVECVLGVTVGIAVGARGDDTGEIAFSMVSIPDDFFC